MTAPTIKNAVKTLGLVKAENAPNTANATADTFLIVGMILALQLLQKFVNDSRHVKAEDFKA